MSLHWETWSTASQTALGMASTRGLPPLHSFDLAVHVMPRSVSLLTYVAVRGNWRRLLKPWRSRWHVTEEVEVEIPDREGRRVTHAAVLDQRLRFGPSVMGGAEGFEDELEGTFSGDLAVRVSWPGTGRESGFVVPPAKLPGNLEKSDEGTDVGELSRQISRRASGWATGWFPWRLGRGRAGSPGSPRSGSPRGAKHRLQRQHSKGFGDERLVGLRFDPQDPENARMLLDSPAPKALPGYDLQRLARETCSLAARRKVGAKPFPGRRVEQLLGRAEREGLDTQRILVPAFEREVREEADRVDVAPGASDLDARLKAKMGKIETEYRRDFMRRIRARVHKLTTVKTHMSYRSIVKEWGAESQEYTWMERLEELQSMFEPSRPLRPRGGQRKQEISAKSVRVHVSLAKVHNTPLRCEDPRGGGGGGGGGAYGPGGQALQQGSQFSLGGAAGAAQPSFGQMPADQMAPV